ncbi:hypothetical protein ACFLZV_02205 [Candidatus Margulisiibacteriota bacterium]
MRNRITLLLVLAITLIALISCRGVNAEKKFLLKNTNKKEVVQITIDALREEGYAIDKQDYEQGIIIASAPFNYWVQSVAPDVQVIIQEAVNDKKIIIVFFRIVMGEFIDFFGSAQSAANLIPERIAEALDQHLEEI